MQSTQFKYETGRNAESPDRNPPLRVVIAYDDLAVGKRAMRVLADLGKGLGDDIEFQPLLATVEQVLPAANKLRQCSGAMIAVLTQFARIQPYSPWGINE